MALTKAGNPANTSNDGCLTPKRMLFQTRQFLRPIVAFAIAAIGATVVGCDRSSSAGNNEVDDSYFDAKAQVVERVHRNQLRQEPTEFLRSRSSDLVHWQGWSPTVFEDAKAEQRLVFAVFVSARFPSSIRLLDDLRRRTELSQLLNEKYVCVLADVDAFPELAIYMSLLCGEIKKPTSFPAIAWISHEGNPVAWLPLDDRGVDGFDEIFGGSDLMVSRIWKDSARYVIVNSAQDNEGRLRRNKLEPVELSDLDALRTVVKSSARQLASLYDPTTKSMDGGGGLVPASLLRFAGETGLSPIMDEQVAESLKELVSGLSSTLQRSAIRDPLDGGFFAARHSSGWEIPQLMKTSSTQSLLAGGFAVNSQLTGNPELLELAKDCLDFVEQQFVEGDNSTGSFSGIVDSKVGDRAYFWSQEKVQELLPEAEYEVVREAFGLSSLGNLPMEVDPRRDYFRKNTLGEKKTPSQIAAATGQSAEDVTKLYDAACLRLLTHRKELVERSNSVFTEQTRITSINAHYLMALAEMAGVTGDSSYTTRAQAVLNHILTRHISEDGRLLRIAAAEGRRSVAARGEDYSTMLVALFALYRVDLDPKHMAVAQSLMEEAMEVLLDDNGLLAENPADERTTILPIYSTSMIFGGSTWGTIYGPLERIVQLSGSESLGAAALKLRAHLLPLAERVPMIHTDFLVSALVPLTDTVVYLTGEPGTPAFDDLHHLLLRHQYDGVTILHVAPGLPSAFALPQDTGVGASVRIAGQDAGKASMAAELERLLVPSAR
jgi:uncharacterized protein YyaL (SSP411 family)